MMRLPPTHDTPDVTVVQQQCEWLTAAENTPETHEELAAWEALAAEVWGQDC